MKYNTLGRTEILVSELCLGTMTYGTQTSEDDAFRQMDMAIDHGINIFDTAELYPVNPISRNTVGDSERIVGNWLKKSGKRNDVLIATKIAGEGMQLIRNGEPITAHTLNRAIEGSLQRLQIGTIDLYQLHWPNRGSYMFRKNWTYDPSGQKTDDTLANMEEVLAALQGLRDQGKVRHFGLSNESAWGTAQWLRLAQANNWPRMQSIQNEYSLLCRLFDTDLAELAHNEKIGLLAYSPLATGILTGKYQNGRIPPASRREHSHNLGNRATDRAWQAVDAYLDLANRFEVALPHLALAWCRARPFMTSAIFGATTTEQLTFLLDSVDVHLDDACLAEIDAVNRTIPMPF
ncbi:MAG: aldo/keto reductase [Rhodobacteraceae bacterium]|nr:aldo/keto reductase [Paracoccaceae bacterium]